MSFGSRNKDEVRMQFMPKMDRWFPCHRSMVYRASQGLASPDGLVFDGG